jgi:hypothetical protein
VLDEDYLILSTIHSAKGQEWDAVYVLHLSRIPTAPRSSIKVHSTAIRGKPLSRGHLYGLLANPNYTVRSRIQG